MKKNIYLLIIICSFLINCPNILASNTKENIYNLNTPEQICNAVKDGKVKIGIDNYYDQNSYLMTPLEDKCNNFNDPSIINVTEGESYSPWVRFGQNDAKHDYYYDDIVAPKNEKRYFFINNKSEEYSKTTKKINQQATLKPGENIFIELNLNNIDSSNLNTSNLEDLRLIITYGLVSTDRNISFYNSIAYYVYTNNDVEYGPYRLDDAQYINRHYYGNGSPITQVDEYQLVSENLLNNVPENIIIKKIKIVPYEYFPIHTGSFRFYSIELDDYKSGYKNNKEYINISNAENKIRHNIVDNMIANSTLKWNISSDSQVKLHFYSHLGSYNPAIYHGGSEKNYYGIPYVNTIDATINSFLSQTSKNLDGFHSYNITEKYLKDTQSTKFKIDNPNSSELNIKKGETINEDLYVYEIYESSDSKPIRKKNLEQYDFITNKPGYFFGQDCSSSTFYSVGTELPYLDSMAGSRRYYHNKQVKILGDLNFTYKGLEMFLRENNILNSNKQSELSLYDNYYSAYIKKKNNQEKIYNGYSLLIPGDFVSKSGHVRMVSGYSHVVCNDGTQTNHYNEGFCNNHGGFNPDESYVITTEIGGAKYLDHIKESDTGWSINLTDYTDIKNIDYLWGYKKELDDEGNEVITYNIDPSLRSFNVNAKYTFSSLYGEDNSIDGEIDSEPGMYLPFRYVLMNEVSQNQIEKPTTKIVLDKEYKDTSNIMYDYVKKNKKLKGVLVTNYMIKGIKIEINNQKYYIYPNQTNIFSLSTDINDEKILNAIENINYDNDFEIKISLDYGPNIDKVKEEINADNEGYSEVIRINNEEYLKGDMNHNNKIDLKDIIILIKKYLGVEDANNQDVSIGDMNNNNKIDLKDIILLIKKYLGIN